MLVYLSSSSYIAIFRATEPVKWCKTCLRVGYFEFPLAEDRAGEKFLELVDHMNIQLLPRAHVRQKVSQLTSFVEYFIVWLTYGL